MSTFVLPDLGEGLQDAEIVDWHVAEGDHVTEDQPLVSVETDKAIVDVPSPHAGRIAHLLAKAGDRVKVGVGLVDFEEGPHVDTGTVMGVLPQAPPTPAAPAPRAAAMVLPTPHDGRHVNPGVHASPAVRAYARQLGIDLATVAGTGPEGVVTRADLERVHGTASASAGEPVRGMRRTMVDRMTRAHTQIVPATLWDDADVEAWWSVDHDVTSRLIRGVVDACAVVPQLNAWFDAEAMTLQAHPKVDLGIAVDTPDGLIVPVLRDAGRAADELRGELDALKAAAPARTLSPADLRDPTITLSNFGMLAGRHAALVIVPPQVAIVGAGRITREASLTDNGIRFTHRLPLSVTFDHRVISGGDACRFLAAMIASLERAGTT